MLQEIRIIIIVHTNIEVVESAWEKVINLSGYV